MRSSDGLPAMMQWDWVAVRNSTYQVSIADNAISVNGKAVIYDHFRIVEQDGALTVNLMVFDPAEEDDFQRRNITGLVITPDGEFFVYNVKFSEQLTRQE